jgi:hypothetical protein
MVLFYMEFKVRGWQFGIKFGSTHVQTKSFYFCENSHMVNHSNFWYVTFYPPHENLVLEIKLIQGVVRVFTSVCLLFLLYVELPNVDEVTTCLFQGSTGA